MTGTFITPGEVPGLELTGPWTPRLPGEAIAHWAATVPDAPAHTFIDYLADRHGPRRSYSWREMGQWTAALAHRITQYAERSDRVAILTPQGPEFIAGFFAALRAGRIAVPLFQPDLPGHGERLEAVFDDCSPRVVITTADKRELVDKLIATRGLTGEITVLMPEEVAGADGVADAAAFTPPEISWDDIAYLQYTSGSTRIPAGVELTNRNLVVNLYEITQSHRLDPVPGRVTAVSWLPLFHDMGLLLGAAATALHGVHGVVFDPLAFVLKPSRWITELGAHPGVFSAAPNFAYSLAAKKIKPAELETLDLSRVIGLVDGAEPVLPATLELFASTFGPRGLPDTALRPSYGLAEATLFVSVGDPASPIVTIDADALALQEGRLEPAAESSRATRLVSCGRESGPRLSIVDPATCRRLPDGQVGEIWVHGPNVGVGYWRKPAETEHHFRAVLVDAAEHGLPSGPWLRTGDLGAFRDGTMYITGRQKDLMIIDGRNIYPHDIEFTVERAHDAIALHRLAAFEVPLPDGEGIVVVAEQYRQAADAADHLSEIAAAARRAVSEEHAVGLHAFVLISPDTIPWTSSGKIARQATRTAYLEGRLQVVTPA